MVILEEPTTDYDAYDSINELLNNLEFETQRTKRMVEAPWQAVFPHLRVSPIEEPRASSISTQRANVQRVSPPQDLFIPLPSRESDEKQHKDMNRRPTGQNCRPAEQNYRLDANAFDRRPATSPVAPPQNPRVVKSRNWLNKHQEELQQNRPSYAPVTRPYTEPPLIQSARPRLFTAEPRLRFDFTPKPRFSSDPLPLFDHQRKSKKHKSKKAHKSDGDLQEICRKLADSREKCYKASLREVHYRFEDLERHQQQSARNSRGSS